MEKPTSTTRSTTDRLLEAERRNADTQLVDRTAGSDRQVGAVVGKARERARDVLELARLREDERSHSGMSPSERDAVAAERERADEVLCREYEAADEVAAREREERLRLAADLLDSERAGTDASLLLERTRADEILTSRDDFLGMVGRDLRNELSIIALNVADIISSAPRDPVFLKTFQSANNIQRVTLRMNRMIGDLIDITSIRSGNLKVSRQERDIGFVVNEVMDTFRYLAFAKKIALDREIIGEPLKVSYDRPRILQVLGNLLTNALGATSEGGRITVRAERQDCAVLLTVSDTGCGIPPERLESIFEHFAQRQSAGRKGLGLGLYIARNIVEAHGGRIWVESTVGSGSTFRFTIVDRR